MARILVIDDEEAHIYLNTLLFKSIGITDVESKLSGIAGLKYLQECDKNAAFPELIFVDLNMTEMDGFMFLQLFEDNFQKYLEKSRVIVLTNSIFDREREEAMKFRSVHDFWSKPLSKIKVQELLKELNLTSSCN